MNKLSFTLTILLILLSFNAAYPNYLLEGLTPREKIQLAGKFGGLQSKSISNNEAEAYIQEGLITIEFTTTLINEEISIIIKNNNNDYLLLNGIYTVNCPNIISVLFESSPGEKYSIEISTENGYYNGFFES